jgi:hypothetical protein
VRETETDQQDNPFTHAQTQAQHTKYGWNHTAARLVQGSVRISLIGLPLAAVCLAGFTAACSGQVPADGTLTGHLYGVGGPAPVPDEVTPVMRHAKNT